MDRVRSLQQEICRLQARQLREIAAYHRDRGGSGDVVSEVALALAIGELAARRQLDLACALVARLPNTLAAMENGIIDSHKASKIAEPTACLTDEKARDVDALLADRIAGRDPASIRRMATTAVHRVDPDGAAERAQRRRLHRRVELLPGDDGMAALLAHLPAEVAGAAYARIDRHARALRAADETRTTDQLRTDVLADLLLGSGAGTTASKAEVFVYVDLRTLMQLNNDPAELAGHGPIPAHIARQIAMDPTSVWRRIVTDPLTGKPVDAGRRRYRPPAVTDDYVRVRDRECRFPGCHRPSQRGDLDHVTAWNDNGQTHQANLVGLCRRHHRLKNVPGWKYQFDKYTHELTITTPSGYVHTSPPDYFHEPIPPPR
ncbi:hypothetical protein FHU38_002878 [Saccharomonospora amisosensis]|uniref:HNH nuclease domain-containing protein n=1 Tax=Saccharomonospora amisosensis TaxID=1128677 RepID=A0A7X5ZR56_9PSEU|nr:HNH endonuclease signature motif containing protein [Saccharomonospora amisosensis]NIJ12534.1 hypothetical protein [Saccharomonospora amisosensis]